VTREGSPSLLGPQLFKSVSKVSSLRVLAPVGSLTFASARSGLGHKRTEEENGLCLLSLTLGVPFPVPLYDRTSRLLLAHYQLLVPTSSLLAVLSSVQGNTREENIVNLPPSPL
jgi:hypothetical protein